jgi:hypothetical protein
LIRFFVSDTVTTTNVKKKKRSVMVPLNLLRHTRTMHVSTKALATTGSTIFKIFILRLSPPAQINKYAGLIKLDGQ